MSKKAKQKERQYLRELRKAETVAREMLHEELAAASPYVANPCYGTALEHGPERPTRGKREAAALRKVYSNDAP